MALRGTGDIRLAIVVDPDLSTGFLANTAGAIAIGLGAVAPDLGGTVLGDRAGVSIMSSADRPVPILQADADVMQSLLARAADRPEGAHLVAFPAFARRLHSFEDYAAAFPDRLLAAEKLDGLGLAGPANWVRSLTGSLKLLR